MRNRNQRKRESKEIDKELLKNYVKKLNDSTLQYKLKKILNGDYIIKDEDSIEGIASKKKEISECIEGIASKLWWKTELKTEVEKKAIKNNKQFFYGQARNIKNVKNYRLNTMRYQIDSKLPEEIKKRYAFEVGDFIYSKRPQPRSKYEIAIPINQNEWVLAKVDSLMLLGFESKKEIRNLQNKSEEDIKIEFNKKINEAQNQIFLLSQLADIHQKIKDKPILELDDRKTLFNISNRITYKQIKTVVDDCLSNWNFTNKQKLDEIITSLKIDGNEMIDYRPRTIEKNFVNKLTENQHFQQTVDSFINVIHIDIENDDKNQNFNIVVGRINNIISIIRVLVNSDQIELPELPDDCKERMIYKAMLIQAASKSPGKEHLNEMFEWVQYQSKREKSQPRKIR